MARPKKTDNSIEDLKLKVFLTEDRADLIQAAKDLLIALVMAPGSNKTSGDTIAPMKAKRGRKALFKPRKAAGAKRGRKPKNVSEE